jgi:uncharacterized protein YqeY
VVEERSIRQRMEADLKDAMRAGDQVSRDAIRYLLAAFKNAEIERRGELSRDEGLAVLRRVQKQLADAIDQYRAGGRADLAEKEEAQLAVLKRYLPADVTDEELGAALDEIIAATGASGPRDMGKVMPALMARFGERADGRRLSQAVRERLAAMP